MARRKRIPHNPAATVHDRRATDLLRNAVVAPIEVDDPYDPESKIIVMRSIKDPLANLHARGFIDDAQYHAGRAFQRDFETAERGPRAIDPSKEAVDGGLMPEPITEAQWKAANMLKEVYEKLGMDGSAIAHDVLIGHLSAAKVAERRGFTGEGWAKFFAAKFQDCLSILAVVYGLAMERR